MHHQIPSICFTFILVAAVLATNSEAKRGCSNYGHSCFGGHGKRSSSDLSTVADGYPIDSPSSLPIVKFLQQTKREYGQQIDQQQQQQQQQLHNNYDSQLLSDDGGYQDQRFTVYELLKQWMSDLRRVRQENGIGSAAGNNNNNNNNGQESEFVITKNINENNRN